MVTLIPRYSGVALRKESVDRNIVVISSKIVGHIVALRKESVDRNKGVINCMTFLFSRSPQGERG